MAEKPSGITTGDGTQGSPYEVHSYDEIYWCCTDTEARPTGWATGTPVYLKLVSDIDCQDYDVDFTWNISVAHGIDFDLATHTIKTFYIAANGHLFYSNIANSVLSVHDGKILNVYAQWETGSTALFKSDASSAYIQTKNISFSVDVDKFKESIFAATGASAASHKITNCSFYLQNVHPLDTYHTCMTHGAVTYSCCDFMLIQKPDTYFQGSTSATNNYSFDTGGSVYTNCRFQGTIVCKSYNSNPAYNKLFSSTLRNCVYAVDTTISQLTENSTTQTAYTICSANSTSVYGIYNSDLFHIHERITNFQFDLGNRYAACTTFEMDRGENPNAAEVLVNEKHFDVIVG